MAYTKTNWQNLPNQTTPINATNLNNIETGIKNNDDKLLGNRPMGNIIVGDVKCKNMLNKNSWTKNYINPSTGAITSSNNAGLFNYIEVNPSTEYTISFNTTVYDCRVAYYDASGTWLSSSDTITTTTTITTPSNAKYIRVYINIDSNGINQAKIDSINVQIELGSTATSYTPYKAFENEEVYSESEIKIGTWIDGKPLYRKVFTITSLTSSNTNLVNVSGLSIDFAKISGTIITSTGAKFPINLYDSASNYSVIILSDAGYIRGRAAIGSGTLTKCIVILEYTKTTD